MGRHGGVRLSEGVLVPGVHALDHAEVNHGQNQEVGDTHGGRGSVAGAGEEGRPDSQQQEDTQTSGDSPAPHAEGRRVALNPLEGDVGQQNQNPHGEGADHGQGHHQTKGLAGQEEGQQNRQHHARG